MLIKEVPRIRPNTKNLAQYVLNKAARIGGNIPINMGNINESAKSIESDFNSRLTAKQKSNEMHYIVSFEEQHQDITDDKLLLIGNELVKRHFGENRNFLLAVHRDTTNPHLHLVMENRDFDNKPFYKKDNYRALETLAQKLEKKHSLKNEQISDSRNDPNPTRLNYASKQYESRTGQESDEKKYKNELKGIISDAKTPEALFQAMIDKGFTIRANKSKTDPARLSGYYITKGSTSIKPSSIGFQISKLVEKYRFDENGIAELILRFESPLPADEFTEISSSPGTDPDPKPNRRESLYTKFQTVDGVNYTSKNEKYKTGFTVNTNSVSFINPNEMSIKAGMQALIAQGTKGPFYLTGSQDFKRKTWLVSAMMGLEVSNYQPSKSDLSALFERVKANQEKYPKAKILLLERHITALKKENFEIDDLLKTPVSFSDLFPSHLKSEYIEALETEKPEEPKKEKSVTSTSTKVKSKAEQIFDNQETDKKLLEELTRQGEVGIHPLQPLKVHKP
ncbi:MULTISPECIES: relaxase/mobilization nuclease domain-containing protein [Pseudomonas]|uniref:relaxase/mobilization nuclease domain-containing protein n=1 Tax=Pseudomonas sp. MF6747 TaxID=2797527 RepID=UPI00190CF2C5|nr:relaxase/mobilization nuclease domain-containing protein [Pseudomonas sp. MF6747]MBK3505742.1 relaxase/mobilization nuclease domain-containing protein [Pseudomonas sp. MF6747]